MRESAWPDRPGFILRNAALLLIAGLLVTGRLPAQSATSVISGTVRDTEGRPIAALMVAAEPPIPSEYPLALSLTDSSGRYRLNVAPGRYKVKTGGCSREASLEALLFPCPFDAPIYAYFPDAGSRSGATVITISAGASRNDVDFALSRAALQDMQLEGARIVALAPKLWELRRTQNPGATASWPSVEGMHDYFVAKFIATPGMGSSRMGGMILNVDPDQRLLLTQDKLQAWTVKQLDLIGIAKHAHPVVFTRVAHGVYAESDRALTAFEQQALTDLKTGKDVVRGRGDAGAMLVVGAIRAKAGCLGCHRSADEGSLLGAFRYVLQPSR